MRNPTPDEAEGSGEASTTLEELARKNPQLSLEVLATEPKVHVAYRDWESDMRVSYEVSGNALREIGRVPARSKAEREQSAQLEATFDD